MLLQDYLSTLYGGAHFLILSPGRCGSVMLASALREHPELTCGGEPFNVNCTESDLTLFERLAKSWSRVDSGFHYSPPGMWCLAASAPPSLPSEALIGAHGVCTHCNGLGYGVWSDLIEANDLCDEIIPRMGWPATPEWHEHGATISKFIWPVIRHMAADGLKVIILSRQNLVARNVSMRFAIRRNAWHLRKKNRQRRNHERRPVYVDPDRMIADMAFVQEQITRLEAAFPNALRIDYEQLAGETQATLHQVQLFLGVPPMLLTPATRKNNRSWQTRVKNYPELHERLGDHPTFGRYFEM